VAHSGVVDSDEISDLFLGQIRRLAELENPTMNRTASIVGLPLSLHVRKVDRNSTKVNDQLCTDLSRVVQPLKGMGDSLHKKSPPVDADPVELVTPAFRTQVLELLANNALANKLRGVKKGQDGYLAESRADLEDITGMSQGMAGRILGSARADSKTKVIGTTNYLAAIRRALGIPPAIFLAVREERAEVVAWVADLDDKAFKVFREEYERRLKK